VILRPAVEVDIPGLLALWREADAHPSHTDDEASVRLLLTHDPAAVILAVDDDRLVGSIIAGWDGWRGSIYRLAVAPSHRRAGLARRLLAAAEGRLAGVGAARLQAIVVATDPPAVGFWGASGWEEQTERLRFVSG
jgi:ribosomal protein S18 acetylase RimI-like enzyme